MFSGALLQMAENYLRYAFHGLGLLYSTARRRNAPFLLNVDILPRDNDAEALVCADAEGSPGLCGASFLIAPLSSGPAYWVSPAPFRVPSSLWVFVVERVCLFTLKALCPQVPVPAAEEEFQYRTLEMQS